MAIDESTGLPCHELTEKGEAAYKEYQKTWACKFSLIKEILIVLCSFIFSWWDNEEYDSYTDDFEQ